MEYAYGGFTFRLGTKEIAPTDVKDPKFHQILRRFRKYLKRIGVAEILIGSG